MQKIKTIISGAIKSDSENEQLLIKLCTDIAEAYLRTKVKKHSFLINLAAPSLRDFSIDCIAELFEKKDQKLIIFEKWMSLHEIEELNEEEVFIRLRRLVFSKVNDHIFSTYRDYDPSLSKIIRNLKRGLKGKFVEGLEISGDGKFIYQKQLNSLNSEMPVEFFMMRFSSRFKEVASTIDALQQLRVVFETFSNEYKCTISITAFALVIRQLYTAIQDEEISSFTTPDINLSNSELVNMISEAVEQTKQELYNTYVIKRKLTNGDYAGYFMVVRQLLESEVIENQHSGRSFYDHFNTFFKTISKEDYRNKHRKFLEYFVKLSKENFLRYVKKENNSANRPF